MRKNEKKKILDQNFLVVGGSTRILYESCFSHFQFLTFFDFFFLNPYGFRFRTDSETIQIWNQYGIGICTESESVRNRNLYGFGKHHLKIIEIDQNWCSKFLFEILWSLQLNTKLIIFEFVCLKKVCLSLKSEFYLALKPRRPSQMTWEWYGAPLSAEKWE
jgi:hypothetical protein